MVSGFQEAGSFLKPPGETRLFQEIAPHHFHPVLLIRAVTAQTQGWRHGLYLLRESVKVILQRACRIRGRGCFIPAIFGTYSL